MQPRHVEPVRCQPLLFAGGQHSLARRRQQLVAWGGRDDFSADIASITLQNSGILCFMPRKDGPLWQQYRSGTYSRTVENLISLKMRAAVALHRGDILLFTGNFQRLMQHKAPSFAKWSGQTADEFMQRYPGRDISEEFESAKHLSTWGARAVVTCRIIRSHEEGCPWRNLRDSAELPVSPRAPPPPAVPALHSVASSSRQAPPPPTVQPIPI